MSAENEAVDKRERSCVFHRITSFSKYVEVILFSAVLLLGAYLLSTQGQVSFIETMGSTYLTAYPKNGVAPLKVKFHNTYTYPWGYAGSQMLEIHFGDGESKAIEKTRNHTYSSPGIYEVKLVACSENTDLFCDSVELDSLTIVVQ